MVISNGCTGWYLRVLKEGNVESQMPVTLLHRINPDWPIARANRIMHHQRTDLDLALQLAAVPRLADSWVRELNERAEKLSQRATANMA